jgi:hypothetical protein
MATSPLVNLGIPLIQTDPFDSSILQQIQLPKKLDAHQIVDHIA